MRHENKPEEGNRKMKPKYGRDLPPLAIDEIIEKLNDDNNDPDAQYHIVHSLRKHMVISPQVVNDIVATGTLVPNKRACTDRLTRLTNV